MARRGAQNAIDAGVVLVALVLLRHHDADADRARRLLPLGDDIGHVGIVGVDRFYDGHPVWMRFCHFHRVACVIAVIENEEMKIAPSTPTLSSPPPSRRR